jgi:signal transduction histidine kinase
VEASTGGGWARLVVLDDGHPSSSAAPGFGLTGMAERAALLGGTLQAVPEAGSGWRVDATLPFASVPAGQEAP